VSAVVPPQAARPAGALAPRPEPAQATITATAAGGVRCPRCGKPTGAPIVYGRLTAELQRLANECRIRPVAGMVGLLSGAAPDRCCLVCGHEWREGLWTGGPGDGPESAVVLRGVTEPAIGRRLQAHYLTERFGLDQDLGGNPAGWRLLERHSRRTPERCLELVTVQLPDGARRTVTFDVTACAAPNPGDTP
jgi:hypothetical protein